MDFQKRPMASSERDERRRGAFGEYVKSIVAERPVFVGECSTNIVLAPVYTRAPKEEQALGKAPGNWDKNISLVCAVDSEGIKPSMRVEGAVDGKAFENFLAPDPKRGQIMVMDNLSVNKSEHSQRLIEDAGCELLFLPPYSPDYNPIEEGRISYKGGPRRRDRPRSGGNHYRRHPRLLLRLRIPSTFAFVVKIALTQER